MSHIKAAFRYIDDSTKAKFHTSQCLLTISVGQEVHEKEKLSVTIDLVNKHFNSCILLIDDSLQRHTMALNEKNDVGYFYEASIKEGDSWLVRNEKYYKKLNVQKILRWDTWLKHATYLSQKEIIKELIIKDILYREAFNSTVDEFLRRYTGRVNKSEFDFDRGRQLCFDYLLEECTALCLWIETKCQFEVYPSCRNQAMSETHKRFVLPKYPELLHSVGIKFKNRKQLSPQCFESLQELHDTFKEEIISA